MHPDPSAMPAPRRRVARARSADSTDASRAARTDDGPAVAAPPSHKPSQQPVEVDRFELRTSALGRADADVVDASASAIGGIRAGSVATRQSLVGGVLAGEVSVDQGIARTVIARDVQLRQTFARAVIAANVRLEQTGVGLLVARHVEGDVRVLLDWRGAAALGAVFGLVAGLVRATTGWRRGRAR